jgi:hypothetical protein
VTKVSGERQVLKDLSGLDGLDENETAFGPSEILPVLVFFWQLICIGARVGDILGEEAPTVGPFEVANMESFEALRRRRLESLDRRRSGLVAYPSSNSPSPNSV